MIRNIASNMNDRWFVIGDFNIIRAIEDKEKGVPLMSVNLKSYITSL